MFELSAPKLKLFMIRLSSSSQYKKQAGTTKAKVTAIQAAGVLKLLDDIASAIPIVVSQPLLGPINKLEHLRKLSGDTRSR